MVISKCKQNPSDIFYKMIQGYSESQEELLIYTYVLCLPGKLIMKFERHSFSLCSLIVISWSDNLKGHDFYVRRCYGIGTIDLCVISEPLSFSVVRPSVRPSVCSPLHRFSHNSGIIITLGSLKNQVQ